jgi:hypothetical protein
VNFADNRAKEAFEHAVVGKGSSSLSIALWPNATPSHWLIHETLSEQQSHLFAPRF